MRFPIPSVTVSSRFLPLLSFSSFIVLIILTPLSVARTAGCRPVGCPTLDPRADAPTVVLPMATVVGRSSESVETFAGIPFAQPPIGPLRLRPPQPLSSPLGVVDASGVAPACPQLIVWTADSDAGVPADIVAAVLTLPMFDETVVMQEDCLTVTVQRPAGTPADAGLPVLFWIFGGGFEFGSTSMYNAAGLVADSVDRGTPIVFVAVNYRLGGFGFLPGREVLADGAANLGLLDQRLGLEWVADNIAAFGGDPDRVTVWGESAGAISIFDQMAMYGGRIGDRIDGRTGRPLFRGAIMSSGSIVPTDPVDCPKGQTIYDAVVARAGCSAALDTLGCLRDADYATFLAAANSVDGILSYASVALSYLPRPDGSILPNSPDVLAAQGRYAAVPVIIGDQEDEGTVFALFQPNLTTSEALVSYLSSLYFASAGPDQIAALVATYDPAPAKGSPFRTGNFNEIQPGFKRRAALLGDIVFTLTRRLFLSLARAANPAVDTWSYLASYGWGTPVLGTFHGSDLLRVFYGVLPTDATNSIRGYFFNFVHNLNPNGEGLDEWKAWGDQGEATMTMMMQFSVESGEMIADDFRADSYEWIRNNLDVMHI